MKTNGQFCARFTVTSSSLLSLPSTTSLQCCKMSGPSDNSTTPMEAALLSSHKLLSTPRRRPAARSRTPLSPPSRTSTHAQEQRTPRSRTNQPFSAPVTPRQSSTPITTSSAPRKRSLFDYDPSEPVTPKKRICKQTASPVLDSAPSKPRRGRQKKIIPLDKVTCIPMHVLRAQVNDTSALLRSPPKPSDRLRKLVDLSVQRAIARLKAPVLEGIMEDVVWGLRRKGSEQKRKSATD